MSTRLDAVLKEYRIDRRETTRYPTRFEAFDNQRVFFEQSEDVTGHERTGGYEFAALSIFMPNSEYPYIDDGLFAEIAWNAGNNCLVVEVYATRPTFGRPQRTITKQAATYAQALDELAEMLPVAFRFLGILPVGVSA